MHLWPPCSLSLINYSVLFTIRFAFFHFPTGLTGDSWVLYFHTECLAVAAGRGQHVSLPRSMATARIGLTPRFHRGGKSCDRKLSRVDPGGSRGLWWRGVARHRYSTSSSCPNSLFFLTRLEKTCQAFNAVFIVCRSAVQRTDKALFPG